MQLVVNTRGTSIRRRGERFRVATKERAAEFSAHKVSGILIATGALLSTDAVLLAHQHQIDIVFLDERGDPYGRIWQPRLGSATQVRRRQLEVSETAEGFAIGRGWVAAKLRNQEEFLAELKARRPGQEELFATSIAAIRRCRESVEALSGTVGELRGTLMGLEGTAGRMYFDCLSKLMPENYRFEGRSRQPSKDAFNACLNYALGVLYSHAERAAVLAGLDPGVGFLHADSYGKPSLAFDLIEPFRILAERTAVLLFTGRRAQSAYFEAVPGGVGLTKDGRAALLTLFNERLEKAVRYPVRGRPGKYRNLKQRDIIRHEAHAVANTLLGRNDALRVVETRDVFAESAGPAPPESELDEPGEAALDLGESVPGTSNDTEGGDSC